MATRTKIKRNKIEKSDKEHVITANSISSFACMKGSHNAVINWSLQYNADETNLVSI